jgi:hypothetical protein
MRFDELNETIRYSQVLRYEYKFLENKERLMTLSKIEAKDRRSDLVITLHERDDRASHLLASNYVFS